MKEAMNKPTWLILTDSLYLFGPGGITRVEEHKAHLTDGSRSAYKSALYEGQKQITVVRESVAEIIEKLAENLYE
jgi:hypothetical protein